MIIFDSIMNTKCFINIICHNNITAKSWVLTNISAKNFQNADTRALIYNKLYSSVAARIKHEASNMHNYSWKEFESRKRRILHAETGERPQKAHLSGILHWIASSA